MERLARRLRRHPAQTVLLAVGAIVLSLLLSLLPPLGEFVVAKATDWASDKPPALQPTHFSISAEMHVDVPGAFALPAPVPPGQEADLLSQDSAGLPGYVYRHGGAPVGEAVIRLVLTGPSTGGVTVVSLVAHRYPAGPALSGSVIRLWSQGDHETLPVVLNLDRPGGDLLDLDGLPHYAGHVTTLSPDEQVTYDLTVKGSGGMNCWVFKATYVDAAGSQRSTVVGADSRTYPNADAVPSSARFCLSGAVARYGSSFTSRLSDGLIVRDPAASASPAPPAQTP